MTTPLNTVRLAIKNKLKSILEIPGNQKAKVFDYMESSPDQWPAVVFDISSEENEFFSNVENKQKTTFKILLMINLSSADNINGFTESQATYKLDELVDLIITTFETDYSLNNNVDYSFPVVGNRATVETNKGLAKMQVINLTTIQTRFIV
jgi:hypothetical protein